jgi:hypothetical protein
MGIIDPRQQEVDTLETELESVPNKDVPEKYKGKSLDDIIHMHAEAERKASRIANELGQVRQQLQSRQEVKEPERKEVKVDDLLEDPESAVDTLVSQNPVVKKINSTVEDLERDLHRRSFESKHPTFSNDLQDEKFMEWLGQNPVRRALAEAADKYDYQAADALWDMWGERKAILAEAEESKVKRAAEKKAAALKAGTLESGNGTPTESTKVWSRAEIRSLKERALLGDRKAAAIVNDPKWQADVYTAYQEKRVK